MVHKMSVCKIEFEAGLQSLDIIVRINSYVSG